ncbi:MAG: hypothetical protein ABSG04_01930, partial [Verrucomicrobiota bacterium]
QRRLSQNSQIGNPVKKTSPTFAIWRVLFDGEGVLMVFFELSKRQFRVLRQSQRGVPTSELSKN